MEKKRQLIHGWISYKFFLSRLGMCTNVINKLLSCSLFKPSNVGLCCTAVPQCSTSSVVLITSPNAIDNIFLKILRWWWHAMIQDRALTRGQWGGVYVKRLWSLQKERHSAWSWRNVIMRSIIMCTHTPIHLCRGVHPRSLILLSSTFQRTTELRAPQ